MSVFTLVQLAFSAFLLVYSIGSRDSYGIDAFHLFRDYVKQYNKSYVPGTSEYATRESIFKESLQRIEILNKNRNLSGSAVYGINQFSDLTPEEFQSYVSVNQSKSSGLKRRGFFSTRLLGSSFPDDLPKKIDWRDKNVITGVRNQDTCGACWAFSTVETIEAMYALKTGVLEEWSVQQVIDCAPKPNEGCDGGDTCLAIEWLYQDKINLVLAKDYPFMEDSGLCKIKKSGKTVRIAANFTCDTFVRDEHLMLHQLAYHGPLVAAVDASGWQDYLGGIIQFHCDSERNHAVQIVGYDLTGDIPHYIVRNSWGKQFGDNGYLYIAIGKNLCGIAEEVSSLDIL